jgi:hypothetical protein
MSFLSVCHLTGLTIHCSHTSYFSTYSPTSPALNLLLPGYSPTSLQYSPALSTILTNIWSPTLFSTITVLPSQSLLSVILPQHCRSTLLRVSHHHSTIVAVLLLLNILPDLPSLDIHQRYILTNIHMLFSTIIALQSLLSLILPEKSLVDT